MKHVKETLVDIDILDRATITAEAQLSDIRRSATNINQQHPQTRTSRDEERRLTQTIENLQTEKSHLTDILPSFRIVSDDDLNDMY